MNQPILHCFWHSDAVYWCRKPTDRRRCVCGSAGFQMKETVYALEP